MNKLVAPLSTRATTLPGKLANVMSTERCLSGCCGKLGPVGAEVAWRTSAVKYDDMFPGFLGFSAERDVSAARIRVWVARMETEGRGTLFLWFSIFD